MAEWFDRKAKMQTKQSNTSPQVTDCFAALPTFALKIEQRLCGPIAVFTFPKLAIRTNNHKPLFPGEIGNQHVLLLKYIIAFFPKMLTKLIFAVYPFSVEHSFSRRNLDFSFYQITH